MGAMQRTKGASAERKVVNMLKEHGFSGAKRNLMQTADGGYDITGVEPFAIEIKDQKILSVNTWWKQTVTNAGSDLIPCLIYHIPNTSRWLVQIPLSVVNRELDSERVITVSFDDFIYLAREVVPP